MEEGWKTATKKQFRLSLFWKNEEDVYLFHVLIHQDKIALWLKIIQICLQSIFSLLNKKIKFLKWISGPCNVWGVPAVRTFFKSNWWLTHNYFFLTTLHQLMIFLYLINNYIYLLICICFFNSVKETSDEKTPTKRFVRKRNTFLPYMYVEHRVNICIK